MPRLSDRVAQLKPSVTVAFGNRAKDMQRAGIDVLSFSLGEPDFDTPDRIKESAIAALRAGQTKYMPTLGDPATREVIATKLRDENGISGLTGDHVAISAGGKHVLYVAMHCLLQAGDEVVLPVPAWVSYRPIVELAGAKVVEVPTTPQTDFKAKPEQFVAAINERTKMVILNTPSNPCGTMYTPDELKAIAEAIAVRAEQVAPDLVVVVDEIYEKIVFGGIQHFSIGSIDRIANRTLTVNGLSKAYSMTGWRVGYCAMPGDFGAKLIKAMGTLQGQMTTNITSFVYPAIRTALTECADDVEMMRSAFAKRAEVITQELEKIPGLHCPTPTGAFYAFPDISSYFGQATPEGTTIGSSLDLCNALLESKHVALVPGEDFGGCGDQCIRISFACSENQIREGMARLGQFLGSLS